MAGPTHDAHGHGHGGHGHGGHGHGGHGHADPAGDKAAAFLGLAGGMVVLGALVYATVAWTNGRYAHEGAAGGEKAAAESTR